MRDRQRERENAPICWFTPQVPTTAKVALGLNLGTQSRFPHELQEPNHVNHHHCPLVSALVGSENQELECGIEPWYSHCGYKRLNQCLNCYSKCCHNVLILEERKPPRSHSRGKIQTSQATLSCFSVLPLFYTNLYVEVVLILMTTMTMLI